MSLHLIRHQAPRHAALPDLIPDHGPEPLPRERRSWRAGVLEAVEIVLFMLGFHPGFDTGEDAAAFGTLDAPPASTALQTPEARLGPVRPAHCWPHLPAIPALAGRILHRGPRPASAAGLTLAAVPVVPTVPTAAGPIGLYLPGDDPRTTTQQLHALTETALAALDLHYRAVDDACDALDALALAPLPSEVPELAPAALLAAAPQPAAPSAPPRVPVLYAGKGSAYPPFAPGAHRGSPGCFELEPRQRVVSQHLPARHAGTAAAEIVIGGLR